jgi:hypothetical protein
MQMLVILWSSIAPTANLAIPFGLEKLRLWIQQTKRHVPTLKSLALKFGINCSFIVHNMLFLYDFFSSLVTVAMLVVCATLAGHEKESIKIWPRSHLWKHFERAEDNTCEISKSLCS